MGANKPSCATDVQNMYVINIIGMLLIVEASFSWHLALPQVVVSAVAQ
jgi:hypothetical protein